MSPKPSAVTITCCRNDREELKTAFMEFFMNRLKEELNTLRKDYRNDTRTLAEFAGGLNVFSGYRPSFTLFRYPGSQT